jgi:hypothetical protein
LANHEPPETDTALSLVGQCIHDLQALPPQPDSHQDKLLGNALLLKSSIVENEEEAEDVFEQALDVLMACYARHPHDDQLAQQLEALGVTLQDESLGE